MVWFVPLAASAWVFYDATRRKMNPWGWALGTLLLAIIALPLYFAKRDLKAGEVREGGVGWNFCKGFAIVWSLAMIVWIIGGLGTLSDQFASTTNEWEQAGTAIGGTLGIGMILTLWLIGVVISLVIGLFVKKNSVVENGPTGALKASESVASPPVPRA